MKIAFRAESLKAAGHNDDTIRRMLAAEFPDGVDAP